MKKENTKDRVKIKDKNKLIEIFRAISFLDNWRWNNNNDTNNDIINYSRNDLTNCQKILTHWICYITDRQMPFEKIWDNGGYVFSDLVYDFSREKELSPQEILKSHCVEQQDKEDKKKLSFKSTNNEKKFASRYVANDKASILQTLEVLDQAYKRNIVCFIVDLIQRFKDKDDLLERIACGLHLLTYTMAGSSKALEIITNDMEFEKKLKEFKKDSTSNKKRLWCCIRDYKKGPHSKIFEHAVKEASTADAEALIKIWNNLPMNKIELPGDVWNNNPIFREKLFTNVLKTDDIPKTWGMPEIIRDIYEHISVRQFLT